MIGSAMQIQPQYFDGRLLVAMPTMADQRFARSVIYICAHSAEGAMGIVINQEAPNITFPELLEQLGIVSAESDIQLPDRYVDKKVLIGGPVETGRGFVLHSADYFAAESSLPIAHDLCLTSTIDILRAMVAGQGPRRSLLALGYAGWDAGQLEAEVRENGWLLCDADSDLVFENNCADKYDAAMAAMGIDIAMLSDTAGQA